MVSDITSHLRCPASTRTSISEFPISTMGGSYPLFNKKNKKELEVAFLAIKFVTKLAYEDHIMVMLVLKYKRIAYFRPKFTTTFKGHKNSPLGMKTKIHLDSKLRVNGGINDNQNIRCNVGDSSSVGAIIPCKADDDKTSFNYLDRFDSNEVGQELRLEHYWGTKGEREYIDIISDGVIESS